MRIKPVPPTLREKRRYLLVRNATWNEIMAAVKREFGNVYAALARMAKIEEEDDYVIIRVRRDFDWMVRATIGIHDFGKPVWVERESGTIKRLKKKMEKASRK